MKINKMRMPQILKALEKTQKHCPNSLYKKHLKERLERLENN